jgi:hypothetical protein
MIEEELLFCSICESKFSFNDIERNIKCGIPYDEWSCAQCDFEADPT